MTSLQRGVSDLGCGRGDDRQSGQISWSLTPRSYVLSASTRRHVRGRQRPPPGRYPGQLITGCCQRRAKIWQFRRL